MPDSIASKRYTVMPTSDRPDAVLAAAGTYLFGFTYLYVGLGHLMRLDGTGLGWFSLFVAGCALVFAFLRLTGAWEQVRGPAALVLAVGGLVVFTALYPRLSREQHPVTS